MEPVEKKLDLAMKEEPGAGTATNLLQFLLNERDQAEGLLSNLTSLGEKALPETSTPGRERSVFHLNVSCVSLLKKYELMLNVQCLRFLFQCDNFT